MFGFKFLVDGEKDMHNERQPQPGRPPRSSALANQPGILGMGLSNSRKALIGMFLIVALIAFELFNFDTTRYALQSLLGDVRFLGLSWAAILAVAFCAIDFAGLARLFTPERGRDEPKAIWYLMGAWLLGATMNAVMTWWAVNLTLLNHEFGNEVLSREQLLRFVPLFVAVLVWLTRILFIGAFSVAGEHLFDSAETRPSASAQSQAMPQRARPSLPQQSAPPVPQPRAPRPSGVYRRTPATKQPPQAPPSRPPTPAGRPSGVHPRPVPMRASGRSRR